MRRKTMLHVLLTAILLALTILPVSAQQQADRSQKIAFAKTITEEYVTLLERRIRETEASNGTGKETIFAEHDRDMIRDIGTTILPRIELGEFEVVVQPSGLIAVETADRRIALQAPNQEWDGDFRAIVKWRTKDNSFATATIKEAERREGKPFPAYIGKRASSLSATLIAENAKFQMNVLARPADRDTADRIVAELKEAGFRASVLEWKTFSRRRMIDYGGKAREKALLARDLIAPLLGGEVLPVEPKGSGYTDDYFAVILNPDR